MKTRRRIRVSHGSCNKLNGAAFVSFCTFTAFLLPRLLIVKTRTIVSFTNIEHSFYKTLKYPRLSVTTNHNECNPYEFVCELHRRETFTLLYTLGKGKKRFASALMNETVLTRHGQATGLSYISSAVIRRSRMYYKSVGYLSFL